MRSFSLGVNTVEWLLVWRQDDQQPCLTKKERQTFDPLFRTGGRSYPIKSFILIPAGTKLAGVGSGVRLAMYEPFFLPILAVGGCCVPEGWVLEGWVMPEIAEAPDDLLPDVSVRDPTSWSSSWNSPTGRGLASLFNAGGSQGVM